MSVMRVRYASPPFASIDAIASVHANDRWQTMFPLTRTRSRFAQSRCSANAMQMCMGTRKLSQRIFSTLL